MPNIKSAKKRVIVNQTKAARNKSRNSAMKTAIKKANAAAAANSADKEAAVKLAEVFGIDTSVNTANGPNTSAQVHRQETDAIKMYNEQKQFKELVDICINWLFSFKEYWINEKDANLPDPDEEWSDRFCLALENIAMADSMLDIFILGTEDEKHRLIQYMEDRTNGN